MYMQRPGPGGMQPAYPMMPQMMGGRGAGGRGVPQQRGYPMMGQQGRGGYPVPYGVMPGQQPGRSGRGPIQGRGGGGRGRGGSMQQGGPGFQPIKFNQQARNAGGPLQNQAPAQNAQPPAAPSSMPHGGALTASALASASPE